MAQDPQLFENTWYLQELTVDNITYLAPSNNEISEIPANFYVPNEGEEFNTSICNTASGSNIVYENANLSFPDGLGITLIECDLAVNFNFEMLYFQGFFFDNGTSPFAYEILTAGTTKTLVLTAQDGDQAMYGDRLLAMEDFEEASVPIYPNPVTDKLNLHTTTTTIKHISIFNLQGHQVLEQQFHQDHYTIDVSGLPSGIYFLKAENDAGQFIIRRFIKK